MDNKQLRNYLIFLAVAVVGIVFLYGAISPYQNCVRATQQVPYCVENTSW